MWTFYNIQDHIAWMIGDPFHNMCMLTPFGHQCLRHGSKVSLHYIIIKCTFCVHYKLVYNTIYDYGCQVTVQKSLRVHLLGIGR